MGWPAMSVSSSSMCGGDAGMKCVVWFRRDLRVEDNPALAAAARTAILASCLSLLPACARPCVHAYA